MWQIRIQDPSGETRKIPIEGVLTAGRGGASKIILRDPTAALEAAHFWPRPEAETDPAAAPYWLRVPDGAPSVRLGDLRVREAELPPGLRLRIGDTELVLEKASSLSPQPTQPSGIRHWATVSEEGRRVLWMTKKAAGTPLSIYLAGETGTGKEVLAQLIHAWSERSSGPFVPLHCAALPLALAESELFGHVKGAFTGAFHHRPGALMQAHGGTLFLDEIGDLPPDIQVKLLRFLENGEIRPVGADRPSRADVRLVCATHRPLGELVEQGKFRRDLFYRLASVTIEIPTLRSRPEDIEALGTTFATELGKFLSPRALLRLKSHAWPGNVRELRHALERASGLSGPFTSVLGEESFDFLLSPGSPTRAPELQIGPVLSLREMEKVVLLRALRLAHGNRTEAARILGVARSTLFEMLKRHRIHGPRAPFESGIDGSVSSRAASKKRHPGFFPEEARRSNAS